MGSDVAGGPGGARAEGCGVTVAGRIGGDRAGAFIEGPMRDGNGDGRDAAGQEGARLQLLKLIPAYFGCYYVL